MQKDYLTDVYDRQSIEEIIKDKIASNKSFTLGIVDLDNFKFVNDTYGHQVGDEVLKKTAKSIVDGVGDKGVVGRFGGDEFFFVTDEIQELSLRQICSIVREKISEISEDESMVISASIGLSSYPKDAKDYDNLLKKSDRALYIAKQKGKNRYIIYIEEKHGENADITSHVGCGDDRYSTAVMLTDVIMNLYSQRLDELTKIKMVIKQIVSAYKLDRIVIYKNDLTKPYAYYGEKIILNDATYVTSDNYLKLFNDRGVYLIENIPFLKIINMELYKIYEDRGIKSLLQYKVQLNNKVVGLVSFEMTKNPRSLNNADVIILSAIAMSIGNIIKYDK